MKYDLKDIGDTGLTVSRHLGTGEVRSMLAPVGVELGAGDSSLDVELRLYPVETSDSGSGLAVAVQGTLSGGLSVTCGRCLGPAHIEVHEPDLRLLFMPPAPPDPSKEELDEQDLDTLYHDGQVVDLGPVLRENLVLALPITPLCDETCKGICTHCGADRNREPCSCDEKTQPAPAWKEALARLKSDTRGS